MSLYISEIKHDTPILIIGAGSIGERHIRNLWSLGYRNLIVLRKRNLPLRDIANAQVRIVTSWNDALEYKPAAAFVCTVTNLHIPETLKCIENNMHVFVEKPLSHSLEGFDQLQKALNDHPVYLHVGYMMRFHPLVQRIKDLIDKKTYGNAVTIQTKWAEYLPDWHPWEDYRTGYAARKELGGGVGLTLSHDIDLVFYLMNEQISNRFFTLKNFKSNLEVNVEAGMDILMEFADKTTANVHLNYFERVKERFVKVVFDDATAEFNFYTSTLTVRKPNAGPEIEHLDNFDRNDLFIEQTKFFFGKIKNYSIVETTHQISISKTIISICNNE